MDVKVGKYMNHSLNCLAQNLAGSGLSPNLLTVTGLGVTLVGSLFIASGKLLAGAFLVAGGSAFDALDGAMARASGKTSRRGAFLDSVFDRLGETAMWAGLMYVVANNPLQVLLCSVALAFSLLISYLRARGEAAGVHGSAGWMTRMERVIVYSLGVGSGYIAAMLWIMAVLTAVTLCQRFRQIWTQLS